MEARECKKKAKNLIQEKRPGALRITQTGLGLSRHRSTSCRFAMNSKQIKFTRNFINHGLKLELRSTTPYWWGELYSCEAEWDENSSKLEIYKDAVQYDIRYCNFVILLVTLGVNNLVVSFCLTLLLNRKSEHISRLHRLHSSPLTRKASVIGLLACRFDMRV